MYLSLPWYCSWCTLKYPGTVPSVSAGMRASQLVSPNQHQSWPAPQDQSRTRPGHWKVNYILRRKYFYTLSQNPRPQKSVVWCYIIAGAESFCQFWDLWSGVALYHHPCVKTKHGCRNQQYHSTQLLKSFLIVTSCHTFLDPSYVFHMPVFSNVDLWKYPSASCHHRGMLVTSIHPYCNIL